VEVRAAGLPRPREVMWKSQAADALRLVLSAAAFSMLVVSAQDASGKDEQKFAPPCASKENCNRFSI
jgi:hypothetical protein